jgi:hypothetical protein
MSLLNYYKLSLKEQGKFPRYDYHAPVIVIISVKTLEDLNFFFLQISVGMHCRTKRLNFYSIEEGRAASKSPH